MKNTEKAFHWIIDILEEYHIAYKISGGLAARLHGAKRELADIDIELADADVIKLAHEVKPFIVFGPTRYKDENWNLELMTLEYEGQEIDIAGIEALIFDQKMRGWVACPGDLTTVEIKEAFGRRVPVESLQTLISYKTILGRDVDLEDIRELKAIMSV